MPTAEAVKLKIEKKKPVISSSSSELPSIESAPTVNDSPDEQANKVIKIKQIKFRPIEAPPTPAENTIKKLRQTLKSSFTKAKKEKEIQVDANPVATGEELPSFNSRLAQLDEPSAELSIAEEKPTVVSMPTKSAQINEYDKDVFVDNEHTDVHETAAVVPDSLIEIITNTPDLISCSAIAISQIKVEQHFVIHPSAGVVLLNSLGIKNRYFIILTILLAVVLFLAILLSVYYIYSYTFLLIFGL